MKTYVVFGKKTKNNTDRVPIRFTALKCPLRVIPGPIRSL